jgi:serine/threonine-protein kinase
MARDAPGEPGDRSAPGVKEAEVSQEDERKTERDPMIGRQIVLAPFVVERLLGAGGMGAVYIARSTAVPSFRLVIKLQHQTTLEEARLRAEQEGTAAAQVDSHRVPQTYGFGEIDGKTYLASEYFEGRTLEEELRRVGPLPILVVLKIALGIAHTLVQLHQAKVIHRDIKLANIILVREGARDYLVRIIDFGIARARGPAQRAQTRPDMVMGTPGFMSPEQTMGKPIDGRTDVFALGVVLYMMLTGRMPISFDGSFKGWLAQVMRVEPAPPSAVRPSERGPIPPMLDALVLRALEKEPADRPTMDRLLVDLQACYRELAGRDENAPEEIGPELSSAAPVDLTPSSAPTLSTPRQIVAPLVAAMKDSMASQQRRPNAASPASPATVAGKRAARPERTPAPSRRWPLAVAALALVAAGAVGLVLALQRRPTVAENPVAAPVVAAPAVKAPVAPAGSLKIITTPPGVSVFLDGKAVGISPVEVQDLGLGKHRLSLSLTGYDGREEVVLATAEGGTVEYGMKKARKAKNPIRESRPAARIVPVDEGFPKEGLVVPLGD